MREKPRSRAAEHRGRCNHGGVRDKGVVVWVDKGLELGALVGAAAHEATHAALDLLSMIGEDDPGCEIMAYMVQSIAVGIFIACGSTGVE